MVRISTLPGANPTQPDPTLCGSPAIPTAVTARAATARDHPDPGLEPRVFVAEARRVFEALHAALAQAEGWTVDEADVGQGHLVAGRRRLLPPGREQVTVAVAAHDDRTARVTGEATRSGLLAFRWQARQALKEVLWEVDALFQRAGGSPLRTEGYERI